MCSQMIFFFLYSCVCLCVQSWSKTWIVISIFININLCEPRSLSPICTYVQRLLFLLFFSSSNINRRDFWLHFPSVYNLIWISFDFDYMTSTTDNKQTNQQIKTKLKTKPLAFENHMLSCTTSFCMHFKMEQQKSFEKHRYHNMAGGKQ